MKQYVISGINLFEGGPLSIFYDCLDAVLDQGLTEQFEVVAFVHKKSLFEKYKDAITIIELPKSRKSYLFRLYYEYFYFRKYSRKNDVAVWLSLHDMTPRVKADRVYTYCHNVSPFIEKNIKNIRYSLTNVVFSYLYKYIYRLNIKSATAIIVQTAWMREAFFKMYPVKQVIVARPSVNTVVANPVRKEAGKTAGEKKVFIYPVYPRYFKNFEAICEAAGDLDENRCEIILTLDGSENKYAKDIYKKYHDVKAIKWAGLLPRDKVFELYNSADGLIFSSKMETWGLPISEFKSTGKTIILIDLPYARETLGDYEKVLFFPADNPKVLAEKINVVIEGKEEYTPNKSVSLQEPAVNNWKELLELTIRE